MTTTQSHCVLAGDRPQGKLQEQDEEAFLMRQEVRRRLHRDKGGKIQVEAGSHVRWWRKSGVGNLQPLIF